MKLFIPLADGQSIPHLVLKSIAEQTLDIEVIPCVTPGLVNSNHVGPDKREAKSIGELCSRNKAVDWVNEFNLNEPYIAMQDRDMVHYKSTNYEECINFLEAHADYAAVSLPWKEYRIVDHIRITGIVFRTQLFKKFKFRADKSHHICPCMSEDIISMGYKYEFLPSEDRLIYELGD